MTLDTGMSTALKFVFNHIVVTGNQWLEQQFMCTKLKSLCERLKARDLKSDLGITIHKSEHDNLFTGVALVQGWKFQSHCPVLRYAWDST